MTLAKFNEFVYGAEIPEDGATALRYLYQSDVPLDILLKDTYQIQLDPPENDSYLTANDLSVFTIQKSTFLLTSDKPDVIVDTGQFNIPGGLTPSQYYLTQSELDHFEDDKPYLLKSQLAAIPTVIKDEGRVMPLAAMAMQCN